MTNCWKCCTSSAEGCDRDVDRRSAADCRTAWISGLLRPSYVLGGQNMIIAFNADDINEYMQIILAGGIENPVLIDKYLTGTEIEVDAICDGEDVLIPGIMEHIERAGVHSGDSIAVYPAYNLGGELCERVVAYTKQLALALHTPGADQHPVCDPPQRDLCH